MATLKQIAEMAGVSPATVSRVINNNRSVSDETRRRVISVLQDHKFDLPHRKQVIFHRPGSIGIVVPSITDGFAGSVVSAVEEKVVERDYMVLLGSSREDSSRENMILDMLLDRQVDGIVAWPLALCDGGGVTHLLRVIESGVPLVLVDQQIDGIDADVVHGDNVGGACTLVEHLIELGHSRMAMIGYEREYRYSTVKDRVQGYRLALMNSELPYRAQYVRVVKTSVADEVRALMSMDEPPTALIGCTNTAASECIDTLLGLGLGVPDDVSVVCFDNVASDSPYYSKLTVLQQPTHMIGAVAAEMLFQRISNPRLSTQEAILKGELVIRRSSGPARRHK